MKEEKATDKILAALENVHPALPSEEFLIRMDSLTESYMLKNQMMSTKSMLGIAASFALLVFLNISLIKNSSQSELSSEELVSESEYNLVPTKSIYNE